jgi:hypothetical protein
MSMFFFKKHDFFSKMSNQVRHIYSRPYCFSTDQKYADISHKLAIIRNTLILNQIGATEQSFTQEQKEILKQQGGNISKNQLEISLIYLYEVSS